LGTLTLLRPFDAQNKMNGRHQEVLAVGPDDDGID
jgi:hypothetical protein